ncbi:MAG: hypothetical protein HY735_15150 [Verrucomicrobia bacterium]|nr:hypothetical protein [Verrucomicrobiota bacterium]
MFETTGSLRAALVALVLLVLRSVGLTPSLPIYALDPTKAITQYHLDVWTEGDGLPQSSVQAITQTRDGYLWIGTRDGLAHFDGVTFTVFRAETNEGLQSNDIRALCEDKAGNLWIGTFNGGLSRRTGGKFIHYDAAVELAATGVLDIFEDQQGNLWLGSWNGIGRLSSSGFKLYTARDGLMGHSCRSLCQDREGGIWIATGRGLSCFSNGQFKGYTVRDGLRSQALRKVLADRAGAIWFGSVGGGLGRLQGGEFSHSTTADGLADNKVRTILEDRDGNLWIGTWNGLSRSQGGRLTSYTRQDGLPHDFVEALYEDREGSLWIGTRGGGLARLRDGTFSVLTTKEGLASDFPRCVYEARDGSLWIGSDGGGVSRYRDGKFVHFTTRHGLVSNSVLSIGEDRSGTIWVGTEHPPGVHQFQTGTSERFIEIRKFPKDCAIRVIFADHENNLWVGTDGGGLHRYRDGQVTVFTAADGLPSNLVRAVEQDREGTIWAGTGGGLSRYRDGRWVNYTTKDGLVHNAVYCLHEDREGALWLGTQGGLSRFYRGKFAAYTVRDGLFQNFIYRILEDDRQTLWISSNRGVFSLAKEAIAAFDAARIPALPCVAYGVADGLKTAQCEGGTQPAGWRSCDGVLWFPTACGVARINPERIRRNEQPPPVLIEQVTSSHRALDLTSSAKLAPGSRELTFHYTALSFLAPKKVRFRYKLEGIDADWIEAGTRRLAFYNELPPGGYRFRVTACNNDGVWNDAGASFAFTLAPHFYQTNWFYALGALAVALAAWSFHLHRMRRAQAQFSLVLAERNRIARELHDTLAQGFAGIAFQLEAVATKLTEAPGQAQQHLTLALNMVRHSLMEARRSVMNLRSTALENGDLSTALADTARQMIGHRAVEVQVETVGAVRPLPAKIENNLLRVGQEAITNSLRHSEARRIRIDLNYQPQEVVLRIEDDGKGFTVPASPRLNGAHFGLLGMQERAKQMGAKLSVQSKPGEGTEVLVQVPVSNLRYGTGESPG